MENFGTEKVGEFLTKEEVGYQVGLPWKTGEPRENSKAMAESRLKVSYEDLRKILTSRKTMTRLSRNMKRRGTLAEDRKTTGQRSTSHTMAYKRTCWDRKVKEMLKVCNKLKTIRRNIYYNFNTIV